MPKEPISPITLSILWNGFLSIAEEMGTTLQMTAFSEAVREGQDFSTAIFDRQGRLVAQGNFTPGHLGSMPYVIKTVMEVFPPGSLQPGDGVLLNDSKLGSGHYPDFFFVSPVFLGAEQIGYLINTAHHIDVGGAAPGSQRVQGISERFQEGLRILPVRIMRGGEFDEDLLRLILGNVRLPDILRGDLTAQRNANFVGAQRLEKLYAEHGLELIDQAVDEILDRSEARMRELIGAIPDGHYACEDWLDACGTECGPIKVAVDIEVAGDEITVDFSRSSDQVPVALNSYINYTRAYTLFAVKVFTDALLPQNGGMIRPIHVKAREGSFFNPREPASSGGRAIIQIRIFEVINGALAQGAARQGLRRLLALEQSQHRRRERKDRQAVHHVRPDVRRLRRARRPRRRRGAEPGGQLRQHPRRGARDHQSGAGAPLRADGRHRRGRPLARRLRRAQGHRAALRQAALMTLLGERHGHAGYGLFGGQPGSLAETVLGPRRQCRAPGLEGRAAAAARATSSASGSTAAAATAIRASAIPRRSPRTWPTATSARRRHAHSTAGAGEGVPRHSGVHAVVKKRTTYIDRLQSAHYFCESPRPIVLRTNPDPRWRAESNGIR